MKKLIVNPVWCDVHEGRARGFARIELSDDGRLSICGVIGPMRNGNCKGSAGQCVHEIRAGDPAEGWSWDTLQKFCDIWDAWHLNDMRPYCEHMKALGWDALASKSVNIYHYRMTSEALKKQKESQRAALAALKAGETFAPTAEQVKYAAMPYSIESPEELVGEVLTFYEPSKSLYAGDKGPIEVKTLGWLRQENHPDGLLCKPCPVCGYKYGTAWKKEEVPQDVIDWLFGLPKSAVTPVWC